MPITINGRGVPLKRIMRDRLYESFSSDQREELVKQLRDAAVNSRRPSRREQYAAWALDMEVVSVHQGNQ